MSFLDRGKNSIESWEDRADEEILEASIKKPDLFGILIDRYRAAFLRKAKGILRNEEDSIDAVQETFTKIYLNASKFEVVEGASFNSWAYKILINTSLTHYSKRKRNREREVELSETMQKVIEDPKSKDSIFERELGDYVASILLKMPEKLSRVLKLHFLERRSQKEIAVIEKVSVGAVKTRVYRAKEEFRKLSDLNII